MKKDFNYRSKEKSICEKCGVEYIAIPSFLTHLTRNFGSNEQSYFFMPNCSCYADKVENEKEAEIKEIVRKNSEENKIQVMINFNKKYKEISVIDTKFEKAIFQKDEEMDSMTKGMYKYAKKLVEKKEAQGVLLYGNAGTGKTTLMAYVANYLLENKKTVLVMSLKQYLNKLKSNFDEAAKAEDEILKAVREVDFLCLDDLGTEKYSDWVEEKLFSLIDTRYRAEKSIMITTNLNFSLDKSKCEFIEKFDSKGRIRDRIIEMCYPIAVSGESRRKVDKDKFKNFLD